MVLILVGAVLSRTGQLSAQTGWPGDARDFGVGIISFASSPGAGLELPAADTMVVYQSASVLSPVVARFLFRVPEAFVWDYHLETGEDGIKSNALEFGYEELGLPIDSLRPGGEWVRVIYGFAGVEPKRGWVRRTEGQTQVMIWAEALLSNGQPLFFAGPDKGVVFYDRPAGDRVALELVRGEKPSHSTFDYRLEPLEVEGRWMKVRVVTPDATCESDSGETKESIVWIEYLDERGRPRVWYYARGC